MGGDGQGTSVPSGPSYGLPVGMVYCFNLMMGAGLLALPKAFVEGGWILGLAGIALLAFMSYSTVTFIIEAQSVHNALQRYVSRKEKSEEIEMNNVIANNNALHEKGKNENKPA